MGSSADLALGFYWWLTVSFNFPSLVFLFFFPATEIIVRIHILAWLGVRLFDLFAFRFFCSYFLLPLLLLFPSSLY